MKSYKQWGFMLIVIMSMVLFTSPVAEAADKVGVDTSKTWTVAFNTKMELEKGDIKVYDPSGTPVDVSLSYGDTEKEILVQPPEGAYEHGSTYRLVVTKDTESQNQVTIGEKVEFVFKTVPGDSNLMREEIESIVESKTDAIMSMINRDISQHIGAENPRDFNRIRPALMEFATANILDGYIQTEYQENACGACDYLMFPYQPNWTLHFDLLVDEKNHFRVETVERKSKLSSGGYYTYDFVKKDGKWLLNDYKYTPFQEGNYLHVSPEQAAADLSNIEQKESFSFTYLRTEQIENDEGNKHAYHIFEQVTSEGVKEEILYDTYTGYLEMIAREGYLTQEEMQQIIETTTTPVQSVVNQDIMENMNSETPRDFTRVRSEINQLATLKMTDGMIQEYYNTACGACDDLLFPAKPNWDMHFKVLVNEPDRFKVETVESASYISDGGFTVYEFVKKEGNWLIADFSQTSFGEGNYLQITPDQALADLRENTSGTYTYIRTEEREVIYGEGKQGEKRPHHIIQYDGKHGSRQIIYDTYTGFYK